MTLDALLASGRFGSYAYAYPHKTAYGPIAPRSLESVWRDEPDGALMLYVHVPFCEMRCGFCNLFTESKPRATAPYLDALERQADAVRAAIRPSARFARVAIGGGTPTFLPPRELERVFALIDRVRGDRTPIPIAIETSPATADDERLAVLRERGVTRISIGVQSFIDAEVRALGRDQDNTVVHRALRAIRDLRATLNVDLIYGIAGQTIESLRRSIDEALEHRPEELYLYPLYVRPLTGLGRSRRAWDDARAALYEAGRAHLIERGYRQISMRMFRAHDAAEAPGPVYRCQADGTVGLGAGARSYTRALHYAFDYAVARQNVRAILVEFAGRRAFDAVDYGFVLDRDEQARRWVIQSLLADEGLDLAEHRARFGDAYEVLPILRELIARGLAIEDASILRLTPEGLALSDVIGPALGSPDVDARMRAWVQR
jgi:oxygen-independent coproporphyrinogen-3 oxidase